jgi:hypothetical protein
VITHASGVSRTISGSTVEQGDAPAGDTGDAGLTHRRVRPSTAAPVGLRPHLSVGPAV